MYKSFAFGVLSAVLGFGADASQTQDAKLVLPSTVGRENLPQIGSSPITLPFQLIGGMPYIEATIGNQHLKLLLDLGANMEVVLAKADASKIGELTSGVSTSYKTFDGTLHSSFRIPLKNVRIGGLYFPEIDAVGLPESGESYVGAALLKNYLLALDYFKNEIRLYRTGDEHAMQQECEMASFPLDFQNGIFQSYVWNGSRMLTVGFDSGANFTVIRPSVLKLKVAPYQHGIQPEIYKFKMLKLGDVVVTPLAAALIEFVEPNVDAILGANFFDQKVVCLDAEQHIGGIGRH
jgi:hypothetical protein